MDIVRYSWTSCTNSRILFGAASEEFLYIHKDYICTTSSLGNAKYEFSQHGFASFHTPSYLEYENYVDKPLKSF